MENSLDILFVSADPNDAVRLRIGQELRDIQDRLKFSNWDRKITLSHCMSARPTDISQALLTYRPHIVHFSGHGVSTGELYLENQLGNIEKVAPELLADLFELVSEKTNCVFLNACYSKSLAKAIVQHIAYSIGMSHSISDKAALAFANGFYRAIGAGYPINRAFEYGRIEIRLSHLSGCQTPELFINENMVTEKNNQKIQWEFKLKGTLTNEKRYEVNQMTEKLCDMLECPSLTLKKIERGR